MGTWHINLNTMTKIPEIKLSVKYSKRVKKVERSNIRSSEDAYKILKEFFDPSTLIWKEEMIMLCLNRANDVIGYYKVSSGGTAGTVCDPKIVFSIALNCGANGIILSHNHPSGQLKASAADVEITKKLMNAGEFLDIKILDHIIITEESYISLIDENLI